MQFGHFDDERREYVINRPDTPLPWINYLGCENHFGLISNTGGGYSFYKDARLRRITRYRYNHAPLDEGGRYLYLRDANGDFWSPTWMPVRKPVEAYSCRHGLGYTTIHSVHAGIEAEVNYFIPLGQTLEVWDLKLTNHRPEPASLSLFSAVEFCLWDANDDATNFQRNYSIGEVEVADGVIYHKTEYRERRNHFAYFACSEPVAGYDTQREAFLGAYRGWDSPLAVEMDLSSNSIAHGWQPIGSHRNEIVMQPGETRRIIFLLGYAENPEDQKFDPPGSQTINKARVIPVIQHYLSAPVVDQAMTDLRQYWTDLLSRMQVQTNNPHVNRMVNIWNAYQCMITFNISRSASYFESGIGRGMGFRDSNQDLLGFVHMIPERARERLLDLAGTQMANGGAYHQYQTLTKRGNNDIGSGFNDDPLWMVLAVSAYIKETGDWPVLDAPVMYDNQPGSESPLYEHLERSFSYVADRTGPHGLPLIGRADWNDCLNLNCYSTTPGQSFQTTTNKDGKVAESVFIGGLLVLTAKEMAGLAEQRMGEAEGRRYLDIAARMEAIVRSSGWDGEWFRRAYDDSSQPVGSRNCAEGKIFIEPQGMCVMAGIGLDDGAARQALDSVRNYLSTPHGIVLQQPAYTHYDPALGEISSYPPGYKENGGVFCHTNPWIMIAEAKCGRGDRALDYYLRINPSAREGISEVHRCEPYVYAQMIAGRDASTPGEAKNSWLTGTAAWNYVAITKWILGIRPELNGLRVEPVLPPDWQGFSAVRVFRGVRYEIQIERKGAGNTVHLQANGKDLDGTVIPLPEADVKLVKVWGTIR
jgi:cellobiose phosphorylase